MRRVSKSLSLPKSSFSATSIGAAIRFELPRIATISRAIGKVAAGFDDIGVDAMRVVEFGMFVIRAKTLLAKLEMFTARFETLAFFPKLGFPLVFH